MTIVIFIITLRYITLHYLTNVHCISSKITTQNHNQLTYTVMASFSSVIQTVIGYYNVGFG